MAIQKRNEWLDAGDSEDDMEEGYDSEAAEEAKMKRPAQGRRTTSDEEDGAQSSEEDDADKSKVRKRKPVSADDVSGHELSADHDGPQAEEEAKEHIGASGPLRRIGSPLRELHRLPKLTQNESRPSSKTGVIYLSRVPPFMKPQTLRHLLEPYGTIGKLFLTPEDPTSYKKRVKSGGNKKRSFTDGWVEFLRKKDAKIVAETLNAQSIGGKKGSWYHDDVWNIKYLKGFKWHHLTEQIANENAERAARLRTEISQTTKEDKRFVANVERAKMLEGMEAKRKKRRVDGSEVNIPMEVTAPKRTHGVQSSFRQNEVKSKSAKGEGSHEQPEEVQRVLSKIF